MRITLLVDHAIRRLVSGIVDEVHSAPDAISYQVLISQKLKETKTKTLCKTYRISAKELEELCYYYLEVKATHFS